ncbi:MAG: valine--tRNA ligase [Fibrobacteria bacterium]|nr:valine--tRNA ligase [Fibrobacteria bacterium]
MESIYSPKEIEEKWYSQWESEGSFQPKGEGKPFTIVIPPPNVTGALHMGHALNNTLQDVLIRWKRLQGYKALWQPGTDHAGIATQSVVERKIAEEGLTARGIGREKFIEKVWEWKAEYGDRIINQLKKLGCSCDWSRTRFTMDEGLSNSVKEVFVRLYNDGLIYPGTRLINWCPKLQTALADEEVETKDTPGHFWNLRYPLEGEPEKYIVVSTTRPETMLGDTAVAVHPDDPRYKDLIGKNVILPLMNRPIPIIGDEHADPEKGSGAVKITPAHDAHDFEVGLRHDLKQINVMNPDATMNELAGPYQGLNRFEARERILEDLKKEGLLDSIEDHNTPIPHCYRTGDVIEPRLMRQWFVKMKPLAEPAIASVKEGRTRFVPERYAKTYFDWLEQFRDWCISRQIWWGHQIPVWYAISETKNVRTEDTPFFVARSEEEALTQAKEKFGDAVKLEQDEDVLDTWFSSALWPFSTLGWPENTELLQDHYPTDVLITARDIIYFWVARMMFSGIKYLGKEPFHTVYINGTILDEKGQRMSKSKGNGIDPIDMINQYGCDAVRFSLLTLTSEGQDIKLSPTKFEMGRNFANKLWNAVRFVLPHTEGVDINIDLANMDLADKWIVSRLHSIIEQVDTSLEKYRFADACNALYHFTWNDFCSKYLEIRKKVITAEGNSPEKQQAVSVFVSVLKDLIHLLHPFMPFITEEIWHNLGMNTSLIVSTWPKSDRNMMDKEVEDGFERAQDIVESIRSIRGAYAIPRSQKLKAITRLDSDAGLTDAQLEIITNLENLESFEVSVGGEKPAKSAAAVIPGGHVYVPLEGILDFDAEKAKLEKELAKTKNFLMGLTKKLGNEKFVNNAPADVIAKEKEKLATQKEKAEKLEAAIADLS